MSGDERALRIAHFKIGGVEPDSPNGINHSVRALSRAQAELGHEVAVFCIAAAGEIPGVKVHAYPARDHSRVLGARTNDLLTRLSPLNMPRTLPPDLAAWKPDILHTHGVHTLQDIIVARHMAKLGIPYCVSPRGGLLMDSTPVQRIAKKLFMAALEKRHLERAVFIHALSPWDAASLSRWGITNTTVVIPNGVDPALLGRAATSVSETGSDAQGARVFAFLGRLAREKGLDLLVRGFARLERKDLQLLLAGPGRRRYRRELESLVSSLGLGDRIRFMGPLYRSSKVDFLIAADVFVHTPRSDGFPGSVREAAALGKPCLVTPDADVFHDSDDKDRARILVAPDPAAIAVGLERFVVMPAFEREKMGRVARDIVARDLAWPSLAKRMIDAYRRYMG